MMKKTVLWLLALVTVFSLCACGSEETEVETEIENETTEIDIWEVIEWFGNEEHELNQEIYSHKRMLFENYINAPSNFEAMTGAEVEAEIVGTWTIKDRYGDEYEHTFNADHTAATMYSGTETPAYWLVEGDHFYYGCQNIKIDTDRNLRMELFHVTDDVLIMYNTGEMVQNGTEYTTYTVYGFLYK